MNTQRMTAAECQFTGEQIAKGDPCPECGAQWLPLPSGYELVHDAHCPYVMSSDYHTALAEAIEKVFANQGG